MSKTTKDPITIVEGKKFRECMKCHKQGMRWAFKYHIHDETRNNFYVNYDGPFWCSECGEDFCDECGRLGPAAAHPQRQQRHVPGLVS